MNGPIGFQLKDRNMASKLTKAQAKVIKLLQAGEVICCDERFFYVSDKYTRHRISWRIWQTLTQNTKSLFERQDALICQQSHWPFDWVLTKKGEEIKL